MYLCDTYYDNRIRVNEINFRGGCNKFLIHSPNVRVPLTMINHIFSFARADKFTKIERAGSVFVDELF